MTEPSGITAATQPTTASLCRAVAAFLRTGEAGQRSDATPDLDARLLVGHALGLDRTGLVIHADRRVGPADIAAAMDLARRRAAGEPVARIIGAKGFWSFELLLGPETLVPRPDTEAVVEAALARVRRDGRVGAPLSILDLGTGTGAILLALLGELPSATGVGIDIAEGAARIARQNAERLGLHDRARFVVADWSAALSGRFDLVASNPPYIPSGEIAELALEVRRFDPDIALDGGPDGLVAYRVILESLDSILSAGGTAFLEVGAGQAPAVCHLARSLGFHAEIYKDLAGIERVVELRRREGVR